MAEKDYIAMWFNARRRYGISDTIYWGWFYPETRSIEWKSWRHADADGLAGLAIEMRKLGYPSTPLPVCNEKAVPTWKEIKAAHKEYPTDESPKTIRWKQKYDHPVNTLFKPEVAALTKEQSDKVKAYCKEIRVSHGNMLFAALSRVISQELIEGNEPFYWFFPVNVRGATGIQTESFNQVSGVNMRVTPDSTAADWQTQMRQRMKAKEHWSMWKQACLSKYLGDWGTALAYKLTSGKQFYAGNCSNLGSWPLPHANNPADPGDGRLLVGAAPGTANYPVSSSMIEWYGAIGLTLKMHPSICKDQDMVLRLSDMWKDEVLRESGQLEDQRPTENSKAL
ncbi:MAG: hypothetical protein VW258_12900 [Thalassolituus sp.]